MAEIISISTTGEVRQWLNQNAISPSRVFSAGYIWMKERKQEYEEIKELNEKLQKVVNRLQMELLEQADRVKK